MSNSVSLEENRLAKEMCYDFIAQRALDAPNVGSLFRSATLEVLELQTRVAKQLSWCQRHDKDFSRNKEFAVRAARVEAARKVLDGMCDQWAKDNQELFRSPSVLHGSNIALSLENIVRAMQQRIFSAASRDV